MAELCKSRGIVLILLSQPLLRPNNQPIWKDNFTTTFDAERAIGPQVYVDMLRPYADAVLAKATEHDLISIDLYRDMAESHDAFYDHIHFNENGTAEVGKRVAATLAKDPRWQKLINQ